MKIGIIGSHSLREEILSAILCMQMLQVKLEIFILAPDAADFWRRYISDHFGIKDAVTWEIHGEALPPEDGSFDRQLVSRALAHIHLIPHCQAEVSYLSEVGCRYFVFLHKSFRENVDGVRKLRHID